MSIEKIPKTEKLEIAFVYRTTKKKKNNMEILSLWLYSPLDLGRFFQILEPIHSLYYSLDGDRSSQDRYVHPEQHKNTE
jgi:hypothetical protein